MNIIHFTSAAADPLSSPGAFGASFLPLAQAQGDTHISCLHLETDAQISSPSLTHAATLLVVHGRITITSEHGEPRNTKIHAGMGIVVAREEPFSFKSDLGAILLIVEAEQLLAHNRGIANPERIAGATWPSDRALDASPSKGTHKHAPQRRPRTERHCVPGLTSALTGSAECETSAPAAWAHCSAPTNPTP
jgi:hypothetical protein